MPRQKEKNSRDLPIPINNFRIEPMDYSSQMKTMVGKDNPENIWLWASIGPGVTNKQLSYLMRQTRIIGFRINTSKFDNNQDLLKYITEFYYYKDKYQNKASLCIETRGPKVRVALTKNTNGKDYLDIYKKDIVCIVYIGDYYNELKKGTFIGKKVLSIDTHLLQNNSAGYVFISDGWQQLKIVGEKKGILYCESLHDAWIFDKRGVNIPGMYDKSDPLTVKDKEMLEYISRELNFIDYIGLSFTNSAQDVRRFTKYLKRIGISGKIITKIETITGVKNMAKIAKVSDAVMVARGDLAVELAYSKKNIVDIEDSIRELCHSMKKECVIATRIADSLEEGRYNLDDHELYRLYHEIKKDLPLILMLATETSSGKNTIRNYKIINNTISQLKALSLVIP